MTDTELLAQYWADFCATNFGGGLDPTVAVCGNLADAVAVASKTDLPPETALAWLTDQLVWPCDAHHVVGVLDVLTLVHEKGEIPESVLGDPRTRNCLIAWSHSITSREAVTVMMCRHVDDDGVVSWVEMDMGLAPDVVPGGFALMADASHRHLGDFGQRRAERERTLDRLDGVSHIQLYETGELSAKAREWRRGT